VIAEWRLDRYYTSKAVLLDLSLQVEQGKAKSSPEGATLPAQAPAAQG